MDYIKSSLYIGICKGRNLLHEKIISYKINLVWHIERNISCVQLKGGNLWIIQIKEKNQCKCSQKL